LSYSIFPLAPKQLKIEQRRKQNKKSRLLSPKKEVVEVLLASVTTIQMRVMMTLPKEMFSLHPRKKLWKNRNQIHKCLLRHK
jgi:hypothetical protein